MILPFSRSYARMCISKRVHIERVPENAKTGTYHSNERRARIFEKPDVAKEKINKTKQSSHQMRKTK